MCRQKKGPYVDMHFDMHSYHCVSDCWKLPSARKNKKTQKGPSPWPRPPISSWGLILGPLLEPG